MMTGLVVANVNSKAMNDCPPDSPFIKLFALAYFCAGVGYVVSVSCPQPHVREHQRHHNPRQTGEGLGVPAT